MPIEILCVGVLIGSISFSSLVILRCEDGSSLRVEMFQSSICIQWLGSICV